MLKLMGLCGCGVCVLVGVFILGGWKGWVGLGGEVVGFLLWCSYGVFGVFCCIEILLRVCGFDRFCVIFFELNLEFLLLIFFLL